MSWFFGKKKHHRESPPETPEESSNAANQSDDYIIIEKDANPISPTFSNSGGLYPNLGDRPIGSSSTYPPPTVTQQQNQSNDTSYLSGIPFKLSKSFDNDFEIERLRIDEITSFVHRIKNEDYDYEFTLEISVINEMESGVE